MKAFSIDEDGNPRGFFSAIPHCTSELAVKEKISQACLATIMYFELRVLRSDSVAN